VNANEKPKNKGGRPKKKPPEFHEGAGAAERFKAGMKFAIAGGPQPQIKGNH